MRSLILFIILIALGCRLYAQEYISLMDSKAIPSEELVPYKRNVKLLEDGVLVTYDLTYAQVVDDRLYSGKVMLQLDGFCQSGNVGEPSIPRRADSFTIPNGSAITVNVVESNYIDISLQLSPARPLLSENSDEDYSRKNVSPIRAFTGFFPTDIVVTAAIQEYRGTQIAKLCVQPIQYNYAEKIARVYSHFAYKVTFSGQQEERSKNKRISANDNLLRNITLNQGLLDKKSLEPLSAKSSVNVTKDYLIITIPELLDAAERFANWKRLLGYNVIVSTRSSWSPNDVKNEVATQNNNCDNLYYLLILGSNNKINAQQINHPPYPIRFTDYYYGCLGGVNDSISDLQIGRIPATTLSEANIAVNKIIDYEFNPVIDADFYRTGVNCAQFVCTSDNHEQRRYTQTAERIKNYMDNLGKDIKRIYYTGSSANPMYWTDNTNYYGTGAPLPSSLLKPTFPWDGNYADIVDSINNGAFYILHRGHGNVDSWHEPHFDKTHVGQLTNGNKLPIVFNIDCYTGQFYCDNSRCIADAMLMKDGGGAVAVFAAVEETASGPNDVLAEAMFESVWPSPGLLQSFGMPDYIATTSVPSYQLGDILNYGMNKMDEFYISMWPDPCRNTREYYHCFGDPSMDFRTENPIGYEGNITVSRLSNSIIVSLGTESGRITFCNNITGSVVSYEGSSATYYGDPSSITVCVCGHNRIPYINYPEYYIQDETVTGNRTINANVIKVGSNVTNNMPQGPVMFNGGIINLNGTTVEVQGNTTVSLGTELTIGNQ